MAASGMPSGLEGQAPNHDGVGLPRHQYIKNNELLTNGGANDDDDDSYTFKINFSPQNK